MLISTAGVASTFFIPLMFTDIRQYYVLSVYPALHVRGHHHVSTNPYQPVSPGLRKRALHQSGPGRVLSGKYAHVAVAELFCENYGWRKTYIFKGVMLLVVMLPLIYFTVVERPQEKRDIRNGWEKRKVQAPV